MLNDDGELYCLLCGSITPTLSSVERESLRRKHAQLAHRQADAPWAKEEEQRNGIQEQRFVS